MRQRLEKVVSFMELSTNRTPFLELSPTAYLPRKLGVQASKLTRLGNDVRSSHAFARVGKFGVIHTPYDYLGSTFLETSTEGQYLGCLSVSESEKIREQPEYQWEEYLQRR